MTGSWAAELPCPVPCWRRRDRHCIVPICGRGYGERAVEYPGRNVRFSLIEIFWEQPHAARQRFATGRLHRMIFEPRGFGLRDVRALRDPRLSSALAVRTPPLAPSCLRRLDCSRHSAVIRPLCFRRSISIRIVVAGPGGEAVENPARSAGIAHTHGVNRRRSQLMFPTAGRHRKRGENQTLVTMFKCFQCDIEIKPPWPTTSSPLHFSLA